MPRKLENRDNENFQKLLQYLEELESETTLDDLLEFLGGMGKKHFLDSYFPTPNTPKSKIVTNKAARRKIAQKLKAGFGVPSELFGIPKDEIETDWNAKSIILERVNLHNFSNSVVQHNDEIHIPDSERNLTKKSITEYNNEYRDRYIRIFNSYINKTVYEIWSNILITIKRPTKSNDNRKRNLLAYYHSVKADIYRNIEKNLERIDRENTPFYRINLVFPTLDMTHANLGKIVEACSAPMVDHILRCYRDFNFTAYITNAGSNYNMTIIDQKYVCTENFRYTGLDSINNLLLPDSLVIEKFTDKKYLPTAINHISTFNNQRYRRFFSDFISKQQIGEAIEYLQSPERKNSFQRVEKITTLIKYQKYDLEACFQFHSQNETDPSEKKRYWRLEG